MRVIIYTLDGNLAVVRPTSKAEEENSWKKLPKEAVNPRWIDDSELTLDRSFRGAWKDDGVSLSVDMVKAREIHRKRLKELRRQKMEDVKDPRIESAKTLDELKAVGLE